MTWQEAREPTNNEEILARLQPEALTFEHMGRLVQSDWADVMAKAKRLIAEGKVTILTNTRAFVLAKVIGDGTDNNNTPDVHNVEFYREDADSAAITQSVCDCKWQQYRWDRTRPYKKFEGRTCSHLLAAYWASKATPQDIDDQPLGYQVPVGQRGPAQLQIPTPAQKPQEMAPKGQETPSGGGVPQAPQVPSTQQLTIPQTPQNPFSPPENPGKQPQQPGQKEQLQLFDLAPPPNPNPPAGGMSLPGGAPIDPAAGPQLPGAFSSWTEKESIATPATPPWQPMVQPPALVQPAPQQPMGFAPNVQLPTMQTGPVPQHAHQMANMTFQGGTPQEQQAVLEALHGSHFNWLLLPQTTVIIGGNGAWTSNSSPGTVSLDSRLIDSGQFAYGIILHEFCHQVDFMLLSDPARQQLAKLLRVQYWTMGGSIHDPNSGMEKFATTMAYAIWPNAQNIESPSGSGAESVKMNPKKFLALVNQLIAQRTGKTSMKFDE